MRITALIPARDNRARLWRSLASIAAQEERPDRVLVVDLASADGTRDWLRTRWPEVEHLPLPGPDFPPGEVLDAALARVDADLVAFLAPGDAWPADALGRLAQGAAGDGAPSFLLPCVRGLRRRDDGRSPRAEPVPAAGDGGEPPLSALCCRAELLRRPALGAETLAGEALARLGTWPGPPLAGAPVILDAAPATAASAAATPAAWADLLRAAGAGLTAASPVILVGLDPADRPAGHLNLLGHAAALAAPGRKVEAYTLADLSPSILDDAPATAAFVAATAADFGIGNAAAQLCFEELLRRSAKRPVRLALRRLAPSSLELGGRLVEAVRGHPDLEVWVNDAVSRSYAALVFGSSRARLTPPGIAGLAPVLGSLGTLYAEVVADLPRVAGLIPTTPDARLAGLEAWHAGFDREAGRRLGHLVARLAGVAHLLRTPALEEAWSLLLPGAAALAVEEGPTASASLDLALFAALSGRPVEVANAGPGMPAFAATWRTLLDALGFRLATPPLLRAG